MGRLEGRNRDCHCFHTDGQGEVNTLTHSMRIVGTAHSVFDFCMVRRAASNVGPSRAHYATKTAIAIDYLRQDIGDPFLTHPQRCDRSMKMISSHCCHTGRHHVSERGFCHVTGLSFVINKQRFPGISGPSTGTFPRVWAVVSLVPRGWCGARGIRTIARGFRT